jgi:hypothetical protein
MPVPNVREVGWQRLKPRGNSDFHQLPFELTLPAKVGLEFGEYAQHV